METANEAQLAEVIYIEKFSRLRPIIGFLNFLMVTAAAAYLNLFISNTRRHHFDDDVSICYVCRERTPLQQIGKARSLARRD